MQKEKQYFVTNRTYCDSCHLHWIWIAIEKSLVILTPGDIIRMGVDILAHISARLPNILMHIYRHVYRAHDLPWISMTKQRYTTDNIWAYGTDVYVAPHT